MVVFPLLDRHAHCNLSRTCVTLYKYSIIPMARRRFEFVFAFVLPWLDWYTYTRVARTCQRMLHETTWVWDHFIGVYQQLPLTLVGTYGHPIRLGVCMLPHPDLTSLYTQPDLRELSLMLSPLGGRWDQVQYLTNLTSLLVNHQDVSGNLLLLPRGLVSLRLDSCNGVGSLDPLARLTDLCSLSLEGCRDFVQDTLGVLVTIEYLDLSRTMLNMTGLRQLRHLPRLRTVRIYDCYFLGDGRRVADMLQNESCFNCRVEGLVAGIIRYELCQMRVVLTHTDYNEEVQFGTAWPRTVVRGPPHTMRLVP